jgi:hypothetical protein
MPYKPQLSQLTPPSFEGIRISSAGKNDDGEVVGNAQPERKRAKKKPIFGRLSSVNNRLVFDNIGCEHWRTLTDSFL